MAELVQAIAKYGPQLELKPATELDEFAEWIAASSGLEKTDVVAALQEVGNAILRCCSEGEPVRIPGLGTFSPSISRIGEFDIHFQSDLSLKNRLNAEGAYSGEILNKEAIGWTDEQLKTAWNKDQPQDPLGS